MSLFQFFISYLLFSTLCVVLLEGMKISLLSACSFILFEILSSFVSAVHVDRESEDPRCKWNPGLPGMSRTERCQGKDTHSLVQNVTLVIKICFKYILLNQTHADVDAILSAMFRVPVGTLEKK